MSDKKRIPRTMTSEGIAKFNQMMLDDESRIEFTHEISEGIEMLMAIPPVALEQIIAALDKDIELMIMISEDAKTLPEPMKSIVALGREKTKQYAFLLKAFNHCRPAFIAALKELGATRVETFEL